MDGLVPQAAKAIIAGRTAAPVFANKIGYVTRADCAAAAAAVLTTPGHENKAYDITGPELTAKIADMAEQVLHEAPVDKDKKREPVAR